MPKSIIDGATEEYLLPDDTRYGWDDMHHAYELNRFLLAPNADHGQDTGLIDIVPAAITWAREILRADMTLSIKRSAYGKYANDPHTIEERNIKSLESMDGSQVPRFNWTIDSKTGDIIVYTETKPLAVHMWHTTTCNEIRRDYRFLNLDDPCTCGVKLPGDLCANLQVFSFPEEMSEINPGSKPG